MLWFDAHLDLACLAVNGRKMHLAPEAAGGPWQPGGLTLASLRDGNVRVVLATIFTEPDGKDAEGYPAGDVDAASRKGRAQMEAYLTWRDEGALALDLREIVRRDPHVGEVRGGMGVSEATPLPLEKRLVRAQTKAPLHAGVLVENADPIRGPEELGWWKERGVVAIGLAWAKCSRYATGNKAPEGGASAPHGLTAIGRELVREMDRLRIVHDLSHLSDKAAGELLEATDAAVMASHSNCRALLAGDMGPGGTNHRQLRDEHIKEIVRRGGVIGLNLLGNFVATPEPGGAKHRAPLLRALDHVERICDIAGHRRAVGLGSDMDGGISTNDLVANVERPADFDRLGEALRARGWSDHDVSGFAHANWTAFFERAIG
jgi:membrane dipeptidase